MQTSPASLHPEAPRSVDLRGGCFCGRRRYRLTGQPAETVDCHCRACQRQSGAAYVTWACARPGHIDWLRDRPRRLDISPKASRHFCPDCGSLLAMIYPEPGEVAVTVASLDDPEDHVAEAAIWLSDAIPAASGMPPGAACHAFGLPAPRRR